MCNHDVPMIVAALLLGVTSLLLGSVFSGTETAFYRVSKLRLKLDVLGGDTVSKRFLWFANNPGFFIATLLVGNNITTYGTSAAMVLFVGCILPHHGGIYAELTATLILTPILFVWGEMFPKYLGLTVPNKMLRFFSPIIVISCWLFLPLTAILWGINKIVAFILKKSDDAISLSLGRSELSGVLAEGKETGLLSDTQRRLAEGIFNCSDSLLKDYAFPQPMLPTITTIMKAEEVLHIARKSRHLSLPVYEPDAASYDLPIGYVRVIDLEIAVRHQLDEQTRQIAQLLQTELPIRSIAELSSRHSLLTGLILLQTVQSAFGCVVDEQRRCLGFTSADRLRDVLLGKLS
ncbi:MAG: CNNM domain-containing protein [Planctomycetaceae bacterium]|jgi:CBS domain containing-hemolysin-like protein|nr:CNNM domain-containing protein [Planctomycetaceae bacterium]